MDALKKALIGGECAHGLFDDVSNITYRKSDGTCKPIGSPAKITIQSSRAGMPPMDPLLVLSTTSAAGDQITGRVPAAYQYASILYVNLRGEWSWLWQGWFCIGSSPTVGNYATGAGITIFSGIFSCPTVPTAATTISPCRTVPGRSSNWRALYPRANTSP